MRALKQTIAVLAALGLAACQQQPAVAHDIYTGLRDRAAHLCCGADDCSLTRYREVGGNFEFLTREGHWIPVPTERIMFVAIPGDPPHESTHIAHLCYNGSPMGYERASDNWLESTDGTQAIILYCAFIPPGGV